MTTTEFSNQIEKIEDKLRGFAFKLCADKNAAEDLMQDTLLKAFKNKHKFTLGTNFKAWVTTIMYNSFVNKFRRKKRTNKLFRPITDDNQHTIKSTPNSGDAGSIILMKELNGLVDSIPDILSIPFKMLLEGYQYQEISDELGIPIGTIKSRIFYARKTLQEKVTRRYDVSTLRRAA